MTASSVIVSVVLCLIVLFAVGFFHVATICYDKVQAGLYDMLDFGQAGLTVDVDTIDGTLMKSIVLRDVVVSSSHGTLAHADRIEVSSSIWKVVKASLGLESAHFDVAVYNLKADSSVISPMMQASGTGSTSNDKTDQTNEESQASKLDFSFSVNVVNASVAVDYQGIQTTIDGINASASFGKDLSFRDADVNIPYVLADIPQVGPVEVDDIRMSVDPSLTVTASIASAAMEDYGLNAYGISAMAGMNETNTGIAFFVQTLQASYTGYDAVLEGSTFNVDLGENGVQNEAIAVLGSITEASISSSKNNLSVILHGTSVSGIGKGMNVDLDLAANGIEVQLEDYFVDVNDFGINLDAALDFEDPTKTSALGNMRMSKVSAKGLEGYIVEPGLDINSGVMGAYLLAQEALEEA